jgi:4-hydroxy-tetrahydrodipicolinate synthase
MAAKDRASVGYSAAMSGLGTILTAIITPFDGDGAVDEQAFVDLMAQLAAQGSDGFVVAGTTGEAATLDDDEHLALIALAVNERPAGASIVAGVGSNDTRHAVKLTAAACELGADALLSVTPYYNRPNRRGLLAHYREVDKAADRPILLYNIPHRTGTDMPNDLLAELAQLDHVNGVKQANGASLALVDGLDVYAGDDDTFARTLEMGGAGGILTSSHLVGPEFRRMVDEPDQRAAIHASLLPVFKALGVAPLAVSIKAALNLLGVRAGHVRLPYVDADEAETATIREMLESRGMTNGGPTSGGTAARGGSQRAQAASGTPSGATA